MIRKVLANLRLYLASAFYSYRALYAWQRFGPYISVKVVFPLAQMLLFLFMGRLAGLQNPLYIVIGNILLLPRINPMPQEVKEINRMHNAVSPRLD